MGAIRLLASFDVRRRWPSVALLTLLVGLVGATSLAAAAGARRSASALGRFNRDSRSSDLEIDSDRITAEQVAQFAGLDGVESVALLHAYAMGWTVDSNVPLGAPVDEALGTVVDRPRVVSGRLPDPNATDEVTIGEALSKRYHLGLGGAFDVQSLTPAQTQLAIAQKDPGDPEGPSLRFHVVGIVRRPLDLGDRAASGGIVVLTPGFDRAYHDRIGAYVTVVRVRTEHPARDVPRLTSEARKMWGASPLFQALDLSVDNHGGSDAIAVLTTVLWLFAGVVAVAGLAAIGIVVSREITSVTVDQDALRALGMQRSDRALSASARAIVVAIAGSSLAVIGALVASPLLPIGLARRADPDVGFHADWLVVGAGAALLALFVVVVGASAALRAASPAPLSASHPSVRKVPAVDRAAEAGVRPTIIQGLRMALQSGRGPYAVPVRSTFAGVAMGVAGITALVVFAASLSHLANTPKLYGQPFDFKAPDTNFGSSCTRDDGGVGKVEGVGDIAIICYEQLLIEGRTDFGWNFTPLRGAIEPQIVAGRAPTAPDEVALGTVTLDRVHKKLGDRVQIHQGQHPFEFRIVGRAAFPRLLAQDIEPLAGGALFSPAGFAQLNETQDEGNFTRYVVGGFTPGADRTQVLAQLGTLELFHRPAASETLSADSGVSTPHPPPEVDRLRHVAWFPPSLAVLLGLLALVALTHALFTSVRRHRRDLAMLKVLGFEPRQVRATVRWEATTIAVIGLVVGLPLGVLLGRYAWERVADGIGITPTVVVPSTAIALLVAGAIVVVNGIGFARGQAAARTRAAIALQSE
jgi:hypothetical protein